MNIFPVTTTNNLTWYENRSPDAPNPAAWVSGYGQNIRTNMSNFKHIFGGSRGVIYGVTTDGDLKWYRYTKPATPDSSAWDPRSGTTIRSGMGGFKHVFGGDNGVIYAATPDTDNNRGNLKWFKYTSPDAPDPNAWDVKSGAVIGSGGWGTFKQLFGGQNGLIYVLTTTGNLLWYKYTSPDTPNGTWAPGWSTQIRSDMGSFKQLFGGQNGVIYALTTDGNMQWYKYTSLDTANANAWDVKSGAVIGSGGWDAFSNVNPPITPQLPQVTLGAYAPVNDNKQTQFRVCLSNESSKPQSKLAVRFYLDLTSVIAAGYGTANVVVEQYYLQEQCGTVTVKPVMELNAARKIYYVDIEWNQTLGANEDCEALIGFHLANWAEVWTGVTAFATNGLNPSSFTETFHLPILQDGMVIYGAQA